MAHSIQVTFDAHDPAALGAFWAAALGYIEEPPPAPHASWEEALAAWGVPEERWNDGYAIDDPDGKGPRIYFQKVPEGKTAKNRVHLDVNPTPGMGRDDPGRLAAIEQEARRLTELGATIQRHVEEPTANHWVLLDPEGNEFCVH